METNRQPNAERSECCTCPLRVIDCNPLLKISKDLQQWVLEKESVADHLKKQYTIPDDLDIGVQTILFLRMFLNDPLTTFPQLSQDYFDSKQYLTEMPKVHFMKQETLKVDLRKFLEQYDFSEEELNSIRTHKRVDVRPLCRSHVSGHTGGSVVGTGVASPARASREARISLADADPA